MILALLKLKEAKRGTMTRCNIQVFGNVKTFLEKVPKKKKVFCYKCNYLQCFKNNKIDEILTSFFTEDEIDKLFSKKEKTSKCSTPPSRQKSKDDIESSSKEDEENNDTSFKFEL